MSVPGYVRVHNDDAEVEIVGSRTREERDAELRKNAIDVDPDRSQAKPQRNKGKQPAAPSLNADPDKNTGKQPRDKSNPPPSLPRTRNGGKRKVDDLDALVHERRSTRSRTRA